MKTLDNEILYTTSDGEKIQIKDDIEFGSSIDSHTYENCQGKIVFKRPVKKIGENAFSDCI